MNNMNFNRRNNLIPLVGALYIFLVPLIPLLTDSSKGGGTNVLIKFFIFAAFLFVAFFNSKSVFSINTTSIFVIFLYLASQVAALALFGSLNYISSIVQFILLIVLFIPIRNSASNKKDVLFGIKIYMAFNLFAIIYNIFIHFNDIINLNFIRNIQYDMHSFFDNKNTYGIVLFIGLVLLFYSLSMIQNNKSKKVIYFLIVLQLIAIAFSLCRTSLLCSGLFLIMFFLRKFSVKRLMIIVFVLLSVGVIFLVPSIRNFVLYHLLRIDVGTFRDNIHAGCLQLIKSSLLCGYGEDNWSFLLERIAGNKYAHNGFFTVLLNGGALYFVSYIIIYITYFIVALRIKQYNVDLSKSIFCFLICTIVFSFFEGMVVCGSSSSNFAFAYAGFVMPVLFLNGQARI